MFSIIFKYLLYGILLIIWESLTLSHLFNSVVNNSFNKDSSSLLEDMIAKLLIKFGGIGLTEENYDKYANAFSSGRQFPKGSKVIIIHGDNDTMVPPSNADVIAANIGNAKLLYRCVRT